MQTHFHTPEIHPRRTYAPQEHTSYTDMLAPTSILLSLLAGTDNSDLLKQGGEGWSGEEIPHLVPDLSSPPTMLSIFYHKKNTLKI